MINDTTVDDTNAATSAATASAPDLSAQEASEVTSASTPTGAHADSTPTAPPGRQDAYQDPAPDTDSDFAQFKAEVARATRSEPGRSKPASEAESAVTAPTHETPDEPGRAGEAEHDDALSQANTDTQVQAEARHPDPAGEPDPKVPEKLTDRPEWQALTKIADRVGPEAGRETRRMLREFYRREHALNQTVERLKPAGEMLADIRRSVGGSEQGFNNMRHLIRSFESDPKGAVPMLQLLLGDAMKRAGLVLQSPDLMREAGELDRQVRDGSVQPTAAEKRRRELLELEQARVSTRQTTARAQAEQARQQTERVQGELTRATQAINQTEAGWAADKLRSDPDYAAVQRLHGVFAQQNALDFFNQHQRLPSATEAVALLEKSLSEAKAEAGRFRPKPRALSPVTGGSNGSSGKTRQQPASEYDEFRDDVESALKRHR